MFGVIVLCFRNNGTLKIKYKQLNKMFTFAFFK